MKNEAITKALKINAKDKKLYVDKLYDLTTEQGVNGTIVKFMEKVNKDKDKKFRNWVFCVCIANYYKMLNKNGLMEKMMLEYALKNMAS